MLSKVPVSKSRSVVHSIVPYVQHLVFVGLLVYAAIMTIPVGYHIPSTGLDGSHEFASNYFPLSAYKYGPDIIFTYGPLGFLYRPENMGANLPIALVLRLSVWLLLLSLLTLAYSVRHFDRLGCLIAVLCVALSHYWLNFAFEYMLN